MPPISSSDLRAAANSAPPHCAAARESSSRMRLLSSVCCVVSSSARFSAACSLSVGPVGSCSVAISTFCSLASFGSSTGDRAGDDDEHCGDDPAAPPIARSLLAHDLRAQLVDLRQHARVDFLELAHRARGHFRFVRHDGRREIVGGGVEDARLRSPRRRRWRRLRARACPAAPRSFRRPRGAWTADARGPAWLTTTTPAARGAAESA